MGIDEDINVLLAFNLFGFTSFFPSLQDENMREAQKAYEYMSCLIYFNTKVFVTTIQVSDETFCDICEPGTW